jgi:hypothetical protein
VNKKRQLQDQPKQLKPSDPLDQFSKNLLTQLETDQRLIQAYNFIQAFYSLNEPKGSSSIPLAKDTFVLEKLVQDQIDFHNLSQKMLDLYYKSMTQKKRFPKTLKDLLNSLKIEIPSN